MRGVFQATIVNDEGSVVPDCNIEVRSEETGDLVQIYDAFEAGNLLGNPLQTDGDGFIRLYAESEIYRVRAYLGGFERVWRHVVLGIGPVAAEADDAVATAIADLTASVNALIADVEEALDGFSIDEGTFTATLVGCTTSPTVTMNYRRVGPMVTMWMQSGNLISATSNSFALSLSGIPVGLRPNNPNGRIQWGFVSSLWDNGSPTHDGVGCAVGVAGSEDSMLFTKAGAFGGFTNSGEKGIPAGGFSITYGLN